MSRRTRALQLAFARHIVRRALGYAVIVGSVLIAINHGAAIVAGDIGPHRWLQIGLTVCAPYCVSTFSSVSALLGARNPQQEKRGRR